MVRAEEAAARETEAQRLRDEEEYKRRQGIESYLAALSENEREELIGEALTPSGSLPYTFYIRALKEENVKNIELYRFILIQRVVEERLAAKTAA